MKHIIFVLSFVCISCGAENPDPAPPEEVKVTNIQPSTNKVPTLSDGKSAQEGAVQNDHCMTSDCNEVNIPDPRHKDPVDESVKTKVNVHQEIVIPKP